MSKELFARVSPRVDGFQIWLSKNHSQRSYSNQSQKEQSEFSGITSKLLKARVKSRVYGD